MNLAGAAIESASFTIDDSKLIETPGSKSKHVKGDVFEAKDKPNVPESKKPTEAQQRAWRENIKKPSKLVGHTQLRKNKSSAPMSAPM